MTRLSDANLGIAKGLMMAREMLSKPTPRETAK